MQNLDGSFFLGDNLESFKEIDDKSIKLIYLDPPFNTNRDYAAPTNSQAAGARFSDRWDIEKADKDFVRQSNSISPALKNFIEAASDLYGDTMAAYLYFMVVRIKEINRVLASDGSVYLHCSPVASHYLKIMMDGIFGQDHFQNEIIWSYGLGGASSRQWSRKHDVILFYTKTRNFYFDKPQVPATSQRLKGKTKGVQDVWNDIPSLNNMAKERTGYPTQKPLALLRRIITASSKPGDLVLDPFAGSGTTLIAAEQLNRRWVGFDVSRDSLSITKSRLSSLNKT